MFKGMICGECFVRKIMKMLSWDDTAQTTPGKAAQLHKKLHRVARVKRKDSDSRTNNYDAGSASVVSEIFLVPFPGLRRRVIDSIVVALFPWVEIKPHFRCSISPPDRNLRVQRWSRSMGSIRRMKNQANMQCKIMHPIRPRSSIMTISAMDLRLAITGLARLEMFSIFVTHESCCAHEESIALTRAAVSAFSEHDCFAS